MLFGKVKYNSVSSISITPINPAVIQAQLYKINNNPANVTSTQPDQIWGHWGGRASTIIFGGVGTNMRDKVSRQCLCTVQVWHQHRENYGWCSGWGVKVERSSPISTFYAVDPGQTVVAEPRIILLSFHGHLPFTKYDHLCTSEGSLEELPHLVQHKRLCS